NTGRHLREPGRGGRAWRGRSPQAPAGRARTVRPRPPGGPPMKPLAILKDSLREAWDSKTLLVMMVLAGLFLIGVASIGYKAATPKDVIERFARDQSEPVVRLERGKRPLPMVDRNTGIPYAHPSFTITSFKTLKEGSHESTGEHEFTIIVKNSEDSEATP